MHVQARNIACLQRIRILNSHCSSRHKVLSTTDGRDFSSTRTTVPGELEGILLPKYKTAYSAHDGILYALAVGTAVQQPDSLRFLYEGHKDFSILPSFGTTTFNEILRTIYADKFPLHLNEKLLHAEQYIEFNRALRPAESLFNKPRIVKVLDNGKGTFISIRVDSYDESGDMVMYNESTVYTTQYKGWGNSRRPRNVQPSFPAPDRVPDMSVEEQTTSSQAALYRLVGDHNALHIDPEVSAAAGFKIPLLHGLCSFGFSCRHVLSAFCDNDINRFKAAKVRFTKPVIPGQTLRTNMWKQGTRIHFQTRIEESGDICMNGAHVDITD